MAIATESSSSVHPALLFMPDISGFTEFVNNTEIIHAQNIIQEVLELLIDSNQLKLEIGEIEGDAIFFYRLGSPPSLDELLQQVAVMFTRFHHHLRQYDQQRICPCAACSGALNLKLKVVAHFGEVAGFSIQKQQKVFGRDVIILHRLLKNHLKQQEYALLTLPVFESTVQPNSLPGWFMAEEASEDYDVGNIRFRFADLAALKEQLSTENIKEPVLSARTKTVFTEEAVIEATPPDVFGALFDLAQRPSWMEGVNRIEMVSKDLINRIGTAHREVAERKKNPVIITDFAAIGKEEAVLVEMEMNGNCGTRYTVNAADESKTRLRIEKLVKRNPFVLGFFQVFEKKKSRKEISKSLHNLDILLRPAFTKKELIVEN
jgi:hypothetical protein